MVGSVLMQRMQAERDFDPIEPEFFTTSQVGGSGPAIGKAVAPLKDAGDLDALKTLDVIVTCQGSDYTSEIYPQLRAAGWDGYWIDAAKTLRMKEDAIIVLDPVNLAVIRNGLAKGIKNYIGGNCTVSCMLMGMHGLFQHDLVEWMTCMTYQAASGGGAQHMRELLSQFGLVNAAVKDLLADPASAILEIDRRVHAKQTDGTLPILGLFAVTGSGSGDRSAGARPGSAERHARIGSSRVTRPGDGARTTPSPALPRARSRPAPRRGGRRAARPRAASRRPVAPGLPR